MYDLYIDTSGSINISLYVTVPILNNGKIFRKLWEKLFFLKH